MKFRKILGTALLGSFLAAPAAAGNIIAEAVAASRGQEQKTLRLSGLYGKGGFNAYGFVDRYGKEERNYGELHLRNNLTKNSGLQAEVNFGSGMAPVYRGGYIFTIPTPKWAYVTAKAMPVNVSSGDLKKEFQLGTFGSVSHRGFYGENWTDYTLSKGGKPLLLTEFTTGKKIKGGLSVEGQAAYNVNSPKWSFRAGLRYNKSF
jgi:hypothetical protein